MTMLACDEVLRFVYAISLYWGVGLTRVALLALVVAVVLTALRLRKPARTRILPWVAASRGKHLITNRRPRRVSA
jgi:hypothetical protein